MQSNGYTDIVYNNMFIIAEGELPVCLIAHMDTVFSQPPREFFFDQEQHMLWSPQGLGADDRAGIYAIIRLIKDGYRPSIIFTSMEEQGGVGASWITQSFPDCPLDECKAIIQIDRRGAVDSVYYDCANKEFEKMINSYGFTTNLGTFSDISVIAPAWKIAAVNLSTGYYNEHSISEHLNMEELENTITKISMMLRDCKDWPNYDYIEEEEGEWWSSNSCACCGKPLVDNEGHPCSSFGIDQELKLCEDCYNSYF